MTRRGTAARILAALAAAGALGMAAPALPAWACPDHDKGSADSGSAGSSAGSGGGGGQQKNAAAKSKPAKSVSNEKRGPDSLCSGSPSSPSQPCGPN